MVDHVNGEEHERDTMCLQLARRENSAAPHFGSSAITFGSTGSRAKLPLSCGAKNHFMAVGKSITKLLIVVVCDSSNNKKRVILGATNQRSHIMQLILRKNEIKCQ